MSNSSVNSIIMQNRLLSQAKSRSRAREAGINSVLQRSAGSKGKDNVLKAIQDQAQRQNSALGSADADSRESYMAVKKTAESLRKNTQNLLRIPAKEWETMTEEEISSYKEDAVSEVNALIQNYNQMMKAMGSAGGKVNEIYLKQMKGYYDQAKNDLQELGIARNSDGTLTINQELLSSADAKRLKEVLGSAGTFVEDIGKRAENVIDNAETNLAVINKNLHAGNYSYNQSGSDLFDVLASGGRYNAKS